MDAYHDMPRGEFTRALDTAVRSERSAHEEALDRATHVLSCPTCGGKGPDECSMCYGSALIPATQDEWERNELSDVLTDIKGFGLDRLQNIKRWEREWVVLLGAWTQASKALTIATGKAVDRG